MSKYKVGDKVILTVSDVNEKAYYPYYMFNNNNSNLWISSTDKYSEPLSTYTEPLEAEITRLLAENAELKKDLEYYHTGTDICDIESARITGQNEAWELVRKIFDMETNDIEDIFIKEDAWNLGTVLNNYTYQEAAAKGAEWKKAKEEIKAGDALEYIYDNRVKCIVTNLYNNNMAYLVFDDGTAGINGLNNFKKTGRHIDVDSFLKQIGGEQE